METKPRCDKSFEMANGYIIVCDLLKDHNGDCKGNLLGSRASFDGNYTSEEEMYLRTYNMETKSKRTQEKVCAMICDIEPDDCDFYKPDINLRAHLRTLARMAVQLDCCVICPIRNKLKKGCKITGSEGCVDSLVEYAIKNPTEE